MNAENEDKIEIGEHTFLLDLGVSKIYERSIQEQNAQSKHAESITRDAVCDFLNQKSIDPNFFISEHLNHILKNK